MIDIIIPVLNEEEFLRKNKEYYLELRKNARVLFVDGGSEDLTVDIAKQYGAVIYSKRGRAFQKNEGAKAAKSEYMLFLHVDTLIDMDCLVEIEKVLSNGFIGGCLTMKINDNKMIFWIFELLTNLRAKLFNVMDGDLGHFVKREDFYYIGSYDEVPIMEDILFAKKLKKYGKIIVLPDLIKVSSRKWYTSGFLNVFNQYFLAYVKLWTGRIYCAK